jgi:uncharacterized membrane protein (UPF0127 family)
MRAPLRSFLLCLGALIGVVVASLPAAAQEISRAQSTLPTTRLTAGMHLITAEVAATARSREIGMMFREKLAPNHGMLFIFDVPATQCMWMRNTLIPLSVAFIADDGSILNIADMKPQTLDSHCSIRPVRYALEMDAGWFAQRGIKAGFKLGGLPK